MKGSVYALPLVSVDVSTLTGGIFKELQTEKAPSLIQVHITNHSNVPIYFSLDGVHDHDIVLPFFHLHINIAQENKGFQRNKYYVRAEKSGTGICYIATYCLHIGV